MIYLNRYLFQKYHYGLKLSKQKQIHTVDHRLISLNFLDPYNVQHGNNEFHWTAKIVPYEKIS